MTNWDSSDGTRMEAPKSETLAVPPSRRMLEDVTSPWRTGSDADEYR